jgi:hypothetical protein
MLHLVIFMIVILAVGHLADALIKGVLWSLPWLLSFVVIYVVFALAMVLTHGWVALVCLGFVYLFWIFWICRWARRAWSRRKLTGDGDTSYFLG